MLRTSFSVYFVIFLISIALWSCKKDNLTGADEASFCSALEEQDYSAIGPAINNFLEGLPENEASENLEALADWLECIACADKAEVYCVECVDTYPAISKLKVDFVINNQVETMILNIWTSEPLRFSSFHP